MKTELSLLVEKAVASTSDQLGTCEEGTSYPFIAHLFTQYYCFCFFSLTFSPFLTYLSMVHCAYSGGEKRGPRIMNKLMMVVFDRLVEDQKK